MAIKTQAYRVTKKIFPIFFIFAVLGLFSSNSLLTFFGFAIYPLLVLLLWRPGEPQVFVFFVSYQWLQVISSILVSDFYSIQIGSDLRVPEMALAAWLSLVGFIILSIGIRIGSKQSSLSNAISACDTQIEQVSVRHLLIAYFFAAIISTGLIKLGIQYPTFFSLASVSSDVKTVFFFLLLWGAFRARKFAVAAILITLLELISGFGGYFASYKQVVFLILIVFFSRKSVQIRLLHPVVISSFFSLLILLSFWQGIKTEYRFMLNQGTNQQVDLVSTNDKIDFLLDKVTVFSLTDIYNGIQTGFDRLQYLEYFGRSIQMVPDYIPYQGGALLWEVIPHILMPRFLFPEKKVIDASALTNEFTGINVSGLEEGTSAGIGYFGELYIDFGPFLMFLPIFFYGVLWGYGYVYFIQRSSVPLLGLAFSTIFILNDYVAFEATNIGILGGGVTQFLVFFIILRLMSNFIWNFITGKYIFAN